jgi:hypothetical protein
MLAKYNSDEINIQNIQAKNSIPIQTSFGFNIPSVQILASPFGGHNVVISSDQKLNSSVLGIDHKSITVNPNRQTGTTATVLGIESSAATSGVSPQELTCHICKRQCENLQTLNSHIKIHVEEKDAVYRNIVTTSSASNHQQPANNISVINKHLNQSGTIEYHIANAIANNEKDLNFHKSTIAHTSTVSLSEVLNKSNHIEYASIVSNLNLHQNLQDHQNNHLPQQQQQQQQQQIHTILQHHKIDQSQKDVKPLNHSIKQNASEQVQEHRNNQQQNLVEYHIQQQQHAAMVVASMNNQLAAKGGLTTNPFLNSTIKYELHTSSPPIQLVAEVYPHTQMIAETKSDEMNSSPSSQVSSPASLHNHSTSTPTPSTSGSADMQDQKLHKCQLW